MAAESLLFVLWQGISGEKGVNFGVNLDAPLQKSDFWYRIIETWRGICTPLFCRFCR